MALSKLNFKPGITRESTSYANEGTWYDVDKVRFRFGHPEKIGGWTKVSSNTYYGVCRSLSNWVTLESENLIGVGTNLKFYVSQGGEYFDITPIRAAGVLVNQMYTVSGQARVYIYAPGSGAGDNDSIILSGFTGTLNTIPASEINGEHFITTVDVDNFYFDVTTVAPSNLTPTSTALIEYELNAGSEIYSNNTGWGIGAWGRGSWGSGAALDPGQLLRIWSQTNYGQDLLFNPRGGGIYYWQKDTLNYPRAVDILDLVGADGFAPSVGNFVLVSDVQLQILVFGANPIGDPVQDPLLIRWGELLTDETNPLLDWQITATSAAGDIRLSHGSRIVSAMQSRQEILTWTDTALYSIQYVGQPDIWKPSLLVDNISIISPMSMATANNLTFWMGTDKFYVYSGRVDTLVCSVRSYVFDDINLNQAYQVHSGTNEGFNEVWWFYCSKDSTVLNRYVVYNYVEQVWYFGTLSRSAWLDSPLQDNPIAAHYDGYLVNQESGTDDGTTNPPSAIENYIQSADYSIEQGDKLGFVWRIVPDITFTNSTSSNPSVNMTIEARQYPGSNYEAVEDPSVTRTQTIPVEQYTNVAYVRVRGRQLALRVGSDTAGTAWQLGSPRADIRTDGKR